MAAARASFLKEGRDRKLYFAQDIAYKQAVEGGVNIFNLFFGFRKLAANFVWLEVDRYWHQGDMFRMIPLMRTCVTLDPQFVDAYMVGAWHLAYNATAQMPPTPQSLKVWSNKFQACVGEKESYYYVGADFLKDGIRNNPRNYRLYFDLGFGIYKQKLEDYQKAVFYLSEAQRQPHDTWVPRQLCIVQELNKQYGDALAGWREYAKRFPELNTGTEVASRFIKRNTGHLYEQEAEKARAAAQETTGLAEKQALLEKAGRHWQDARETWESIGSTYAEARVFRMDALAYIEEEDYLSAIAMLDVARWTDPGKMFLEASEMIIRTKQKAGIDLTLSERKWVLSQEGGDVCIGMPEDLASGEGQGPRSI